MSPTLVQVGAGSAAADVKRESAVARLLGSGRTADRRVPASWWLTDLIGSAGIAELLIFHPVRTS